MYRSTWASIGAAHGRASLVLPRARPRKAAGQPLSRATTLCTSAIIHSALRNLQSVAEHMHVASARLQIMRSSTTVPCRWDRTRAKLYDAQGHDHDVASVSKLMRCAGVADGACDAPFHDDRPVPTSSKGQRRTVYLSAI